MKIHNENNSSPTQASSNYGYWVECVPLRPRSWFRLDPGLYAASVDGLPDVKGLGLSPDRAIGKLKKRLEAIRKHQDALHIDLPQPHNRLAPPHQLRAEHGGWMSVYVALCAQAKDQ